jgi:hypothetical protein
MKALLNVITLGQAKCDNNMGMIILTRLKVHSLEN